MIKLLFGICVLITIPAVSMAQSIRDVDFNNFEFEVEYCRTDKNGGRIVTKKGQFYEETATDDFLERLFFSANVESYGDLDGDGLEEAVITSICNTGGTGNFSEAYIYTVRSGKPYRLLTIAGGDRANGGFRKALVSNQILTILSSEVGEFGGACCPEFEVTNRYRLVGRTLKEIGSPVRRALYPASPIEFKKGQFGTTFAVDFPDDAAIRRYSFRASAGQKLTVDLKSSGMKVRLLKGRADVTKDGDSLVATLSESGEFVIEYYLIRKVSSKPLTTVTIR